MHGSKSKEGPQEKITDLLHADNGQLQLREDLRTGVYVDGLTEEVVVSGDILHTLNNQSSTPLRSILCLAMYRTGAPMMEDHRSVRVTQMQSMPYTASSSLSAAATGHPVLKRITQQLLQDGNVCAFILQYSTKLMAMALLQCHGSHACRRGGVAAADAGHRPAPHGRDADTGAFSLKACMQARRRCSC